MCVYVCVSVGLFVCVCVYTCVLFVHAFIVCVCVCVCVCVRGGLRARLSVVYRECVGNAGLQGGVRREVREKLRVRVMFTVGRRASKGPGSIAG